jgi:FkbM family methyltransferase
MGSLTQALAISHQSERLFIVNVGNRTTVAALGAPFHTGNYRALGNVLLHCKGRRDLLRRYLRAGGEYPYRCAMSTPVGDVAPTLYSSHDVNTVVEVFFRGDYPAPSNLKTVVDIGSNIGLSAMYFLTRNRDSRCYLYEPVPRNVARLRDNLAAFESRWVLDECAVGLEAGVAAFGIEDTGRYGGLAVRTDKHIDVRVREVNEVLGSVLEIEPRIDVLKIDVEGLEADLVLAIRPDLLARVERIYFEAERLPLHTDRYDHEFDHATNRLYRRADSGGVGGPRRPVGLLG